MHTCPMLTVLVPHVGGPILPPGVPTVLIGMLPAATVTNMATCVGPPDVIVLGSMGVFINFLPAARMGDITAHGGVIVLGEPTCMVGEMGAPSPGAMGLGGVVAGMVASGVAQQLLANASKLAAAGTAPAVQSTPPLGVMAIRTAEVVNAEMVANGLDPAWDPGTEVVTEVLPVGTRFEMVVNPEDVADLMRGVNRFGAWAATDPVQSQKYARDKLALLTSFKKDVSTVITVETTAPMVVHRGTVGALGGAGGKAGQVQFVGLRGQNPLKMVGPPKILPEG
jgi:uncharacterized Zn-binding protein involved in type VI secretion